jgi:hypothetical protein
MLPVQAILLTAELATDGIDCRFERIIDLHRKLDLHRNWTCTESKGNGPTMNVMIFGATGMVGQGVLRECLLDPKVQLVQTVGRTATGVPHPKLREIVHTDLWNYEPIEASLSGFDACFFCLGVSSSGMKEEDYKRITYGITIAAADVVCRLNPRMTFIYVSGAGTASSERGPIMWARIKGKTENALLQMPFAAYMFRPGMIEPLDGIQSKTKAYHRFYKLAKRLLPTLRALFPNHVLTTKQIGRAMLIVTREGYPKRVLESKDIRAVVNPESLPPQANKQH